MTAIPSWCAWRDCPCLPEIFRQVSVRLLGCDTPELADVRPEIADLARQARAFTAARFEPGQRVTLTNVRRDKYGGRLVATLEVDGVDLCALLIGQGLAREYHGKGKKPW